MDLIIRKPTYFQIGARNLSFIVCGLPLFATFFCIIWSIVFDFEASTATHCRVKNYLPSISAAIGGFVPQRYVWRICIALHCAPRFMVALAYYQFHTAVHVGSHNELYKTIAALCSLLHIIENSALVGLTYISSSENRVLHENLFILFIICALVYMLMTVITLRWGRTHNGSQMSKLESKSYNIKLALFTVSIGAVILAGYLYYRHNAYCEAGVYTWFALTEYLIVIANVAFHATWKMDFYRVRLIAAEIVDDDDYEWL